MRWTMLGAFAVLVGCTGESNSPPVTKAADPIPRLELPRADEPRSVLIIADSKPAAVVWIGAAGRLEVAGDLGAKHRITTTLDALRRSVLDAVVAGGGPAAVDAKDELARAGTVDAARRVDPDLPGPGRLPSARAIPIQTIARTAPLVIATPSAPAAVVARVLARTGGALAVDHAGTMAVLVLGFAIENRPASVGAAKWIEMFADAKGLHVVVQPDDRDRVVAWSAGAIDRPALAAAYGEAGGSARQIDIVVHDDTTTQTLVNVLVALEALGARYVAVASGPGSAAERRAQIALVRTAGRAPAAAVSLGTPVALGDLGVDVIRKHVEAELPKIRGCYQQQRSARPGLAGTMMTSFFITPNGSVVEVYAVGVDRDAADCVVRALKRIHFPLPNGGGGVQVTYPITFRAG